MKDDKHDHDHNIVYKCGKRILKLHKPFDNFGDPVEINYKGKSTH